MPKPGRLSPPADQASPKRRHSGTAAAGQPAILSRIPVRPAGRRIRPSLPYPWPAPGTGALRRGCELQPAPDVFKDPARLSSPFDQSLIVIPDMRVGPGTHMWTAPGSQGRCSCDGSGRLRSYVRPCVCGRLTAGPDGLRGSGPKHNAVSMHQRVPRVVPILGSTDRHLAAVLASARSERSERARAQAGCGRR